MADGGRKPKPTAVKQATGNPGKRKLPEAEPVFEPGPVVAPEWLDKYEREEWERIVPELVRAGIAKPVHLSLLVGICALYSAFRTARLADDTVQARQSFEAYRKALNEVGLTPASAGKVKADTGDGKDPAEKFFTGPKPVA